jgi:hypothetical protein
MYECNYSSAWGKTSTLIAGLLEIITKFPIMNGRNHANQKEEA